MRIIGRNKIGGMVGTVEADGDGEGHLTAIQVDQALRIVATVILMGFRESVGYLFGLGAITFEVVGDPIDEMIDAFNARVIS